MRVHWGAKPVILVPPPPASTHCQVSAPLLSGLLPNSVLLAFANYMDTRCLGDSLGVGGTPLEPPSKHTEVRAGSGWIAHQM